MPSLACKTELARPPSLLQRSSPDPPSPAVGCPQGPPTVTFCQQPQCFAFCYLLCLSYSKGSDKILSSGLFQLSCPSKLPHPPSPAVGCSQGPPTVTFCQQPQCFAFCYLLCLSYSKGSYKILSSGLFQLSCPSKLPHPPSPAVGCPQGPPTVTVCQQPQCFALLLPPVLEFFKGQLQNTQLRAVPAELPFKAPTPGPTLPSPSPSHSVLPLLSCFTSLNPQSPHMAPPSFLFNPLAPPQNSPHAREHIPLFLFLTPLALATHMSLTS